MAFVSGVSAVGASGFSGKQVDAVARESRSTVRMAAMNPSQMSKYARVKVKDYLARPTPPKEPVETARVGSKVWQDSLDAMVAQNAPTVTPMFYPYTIGSVYDEPVTAPALPAALPPTAGKEADVYIAECMVKQYKALGGAGNGVYTVQCAEGSVGGQAEERRVAAGYATFRRSQKNASERFREFYETRKHGIISAHGCNYEEGLVNRFPKSAAAFIVGQAEANRTCTRYADPTSVTEAYMQKSVEMQMRAKTCSSGVYGLSCTEGVTKGQADTARVLALNKDFRMGQASAISKERAKFESRKYALANFGHLCSYEEDIFSRMPAVAATMRSTTY